MSLLGTLSIAGSALAAQQAALQVTSNNIANASDPNYSNEVVDLTPAFDTNENGQYIGSGVDIADIQRQVDESLNSRLASSVSDNNTATTIQNWAGQIQSVFGALNQQSLSTSMNTFFNDWSTLANNPTDTGQRQVVIQDGENLAQQFNSLDSQLNGIGTTLNSTVGSTVNQINQLTTQLASLNQQIASSNTGEGQDNSLLDERDATIQQLSTYVNVNSLIQPNGTVNVYIGSMPVVSASTANALTVQNTEVDGSEQSTIMFANNSGSAPVTGGQLGGLLSVQSTLSTTLNSVNSIANNLISSLNQLHASGQGTSNFTSVTGTTQVKDPTQPLDNSAAGIPFTVSNGSFVVSVTDAATGQTSSTLIPVQLGSGATSPTTLNSLVASLNGISGIQASDAGGFLSISSSSPDYTFSFSQDSSGVLSALGVNTFFSGSNAGNIAVNQTVANNPAFVAASGNGNPADNTTALAISQLADQPVAGLNNQSIDDSYNSLVSQIGTTVSNATNDATATSNIQQALQAQQQSVSGVSVDNEAINMIQQQRVYQGASLLISTVNQMMQSLLTAMQ